jgi:hypothetical protein
MNGVVTGGTLSDDSDPTALFPEQRLWNVQRVPTVS